MTENGSNILESKNLVIKYGDNVAIDKVSLQFKKGLVTAIIGPSGCGKSTFLRTFNRMNDFIPNYSHEGEALFWGKDIYGTEFDSMDLRRQIGMVFQKPNPFPTSIFKNVVWGPKINGYKDNMQELAEKSLKQAALWDEVKDRLDDSALALSGGQQQRLCIARAIAMRPEVILMDEPCSALDPRATARIEDLIGELRSQYTIITVTHNMQQAARISDETVFLYNGVLVETGDTKEIFTKPKDKRTEDYITGRFG